MQQNTAPPRREKKRRRQASEGSAANVAAYMPLVSASQHPGHHPPHSSSSSARTTDTEGSNYSGPPSLSSGHASSHSASPAPCPPTVSGYTTHNHRPTSRDDDDTSSAPHGSDEGATEATPRGRKSQTRATVHASPESPTRALLRPHAGPSNSFAEPSGVQTRNPGLPSLAASSAPLQSTTADSDLTRSSVRVAWEKFLHAAQDLQGELRNVRYDPVGAAQSADQVQGDLQWVYKKLKAVIPEESHKLKEPVRYGRTIATRSWWRQMLKEKASTKASRPSSGRRPAGDGPQNPAPPMRSRSSPSSCGASSVPSLSASRTDSPASPYPPSSASTSASGSREQSTSRTPSFPVPSSRYQHNVEHIRPSSIPLRSSMSDGHRPPLPALTPLSNPAGILLADSHLEHGMAPLGGAELGDGPSRSPSSVNPTLRAAIWTPTPQRAAVATFLSSMSTGVSQSQVDHSPFAAAVETGVPSSMPPMAPPTQLPPPSMSFPPDMRAPHADGPQGQRNEGAQAGLVESWNASRKGKEVDRRHQSYGSSSAGRSTGPSMPMPPPLPRIPSTPYTQSLGTGAGLDHTHPHEDGAGLEGMAQSNPAPSAELPCPACGQRFEDPILLIQHIQAFWQVRGLDDPGRNIRGHSNVLSECQRTAGAVGRSWEIELMLNAEELTLGGMFLPGGPFGFSLSLP